MLIIKLILKKKFKDNLYGEKVEVKEKLSPFPEDYNEEDERRMNIIGQNGNDGEHYDDETNFNELDLNKDGKVDKSELQAAKDRVEFLQNSIKGVTKSSNRVDKSLKEIKKLNSLISSLEDDLTITY